MKIKITETLINKALQTNRVWDLANDVLYNLCRKYPSHKKDDEIIAKVWAIGRTYAAAIERCKKEKVAKGDKFYETKVGPKIRKSQLDNWFTDFKKNPTADNAIYLHCKLMGLFRKISHHKNRSLASKYLHFHFKEHFFIYDSRSKAGIGKIILEGNELSLNLRKNKYDEQYAKFHQKCLRLQTHLKSNQEMSKQHRSKYSPRDLDKILLFVSERSRKK